MPKAGDLSVLACAGVCWRVLACACPWRRKIDAVLCHAAAVAQETAECYIILCLLHPDIYYYFNNSVPLALLQGPRRRVRLLAANNSVQ